MSYKILVALDGSKFAERSLAPAFDLARFHNGQVVILHVRPPDHEGPENYLSQLCGSEEAREVSCSFEMAEGDPAAVLKNRAHQFDLLVMASHGRSGFDRLVLGSVTEKVVRQVTVPVLIVRSQWLRLEQLKTILVCLDGSDCSHRALEQAETLARLSGAALLLYKVVEKREEKKAAEAYLSEQRRQLAPDVQSSLRCDVGSVARTIVKLLARGEIELALLGTHSRAGLDRIMNGSVAENVARTAMTPLVLVS